MHPLATLCTLATELSEHRQRSEEHGDKSQCPSMHDSLESAKLRTSHAESPARTHAFLIIAVIPTYIVLIKQHSAAVD